MINSNEYFNLLIIVQKFQRYFIRYVTIGFYLRQFFNYNCDYDLLTAV